MNQVIITILLFLITSCAGYKTHQYPEANEKEYHVDFYSRSSEDQLEYAKQFAGEGDYKTAISLYLDIYENNEIDSTIRQEALWNLGNAYSNVLYPGKDYQKALYFLEKLLNEFPETPFWPNVAESIANIKNLMLHEEREN